jgi:uncharacterized integral membrane protein
MSDVTARSEADVQVSVADVLSDLRAHRIDGPMAAQIQEAADRAQEDIDPVAGLPWSVIVVGAIICVLLILWCRGVI